MAELTSLNLRGNIIGAAGAPRKKPWVSAEIRGFLWISGFLWIFCRKFLQKSVVFCGNFLQKSVVFCGFLQKISTEI